MTTIKTGRKKIFSAGKMDVLAKKGKPILTGLASNSQRFSQERSKRVIVIF